MAALAPVKSGGGHPWWELARAVKELIESGDYPDAVEYMITEYDKRKAAE